MVSIAAKQRHLYLLQKVKDLKPLSTAELRELENYEQMAKKTANTPITAEPKRTAQARPGTVKGKKGGNTGRPAVNIATQLKLLAMAGLTIAQAEAEMNATPQFRKSGLNRPLSISPRGSKSVENSGVVLNKLFEKKPCLRQAWLRGTFLKNIADYAATPKEIKDAGAAMGLEIGELEKIFTTDFEAAQTWNQSRHKKRMEIQDAFMKKAVESCSINAIKQMDKLMSREVIPSAADYAKVSIADLCELVDVTRMTLDNWYNMEGLPRNLGARPTFNLKAFIKWYAGHIIKITSPRKAETPAQSEKARKYKMENDEKVGRLLDRNKVILSFAARFQTDIRIFLKHLAEQKDPHTKQTLERIFEEIRRELTNTIPDLKLNEELLEHVKGLLRKIADFEEKFSHEETKEHEEIKNDN